MPGALNHVQLDWMTSFCGIATHEGGQNRNGTATTPEASAASPGGNTEAGGSGANVTPAGRASTSAALGAGAAPVSIPTGNAHPDAAAPIGGAPPQVQAAPPSAPAGPAPAPPDDDTRKLLSQWAAGEASPKTPDPSDQDPEAIARRQKLADAVGHEREHVAVNPGLKSRPPQTDKAGRIVQPGGFQYGGKPSPNPPSLDVAGDQKRTDVNHAIWSELGSREGGVSSINTWDTAGLTIGGGFAAKGGALPKVMDAFLKNDPEAAEALKQVGLTCKDGKFLAVDPQSGKVLEGNAAIDSIKADPHVLSRLIDVLENPDHASKFADAEWASIKGAAGAVPKNVLDAWDQNTIVMVAHFIHWTGIGWSTWAGIGPDIAALVREGVKHAHKDQPVGGATVVLPGDTAILLGSAKGCGRKAVTGPGPLPDDIETTSYAGHVFLRQTKDKYWHLAA